MTIKEKIKKLLNEGVYGQDHLFNILYPSYKGHYSTLRREITEVKNDY